MKVRLVVNDNDVIGGVLPKWYGFAYRQYHIRRTVLYIIPLNLVVRYARQIYWLIYRWLKHDGWESQLDDAYWRGYNDGNTTRERHIDTLTRIILGKD